MGADPSVMVQKVAVTSGKTKTVDMLVVFLEDHAKAVGDEVKKGHP